MRPILVRIRRWRSGIAWAMALGGLCFAAGLAAYRDAVPAYLKPPAYFVLGRNSCGIVRGYSALSGAVEKEADRIEARSRLVERAGEGLERWQTPRGEFWNSKGTELFYALAEQSLRNYGDGPHRVRRGDIVLDCGANVGDYVREALSAGARLVVAIEPVPRNLECLRRTYSAEIAAGSVRIVAKAVWHEAGRMKMALHQDSMLDTLLAGDSAGVRGYVEVEVTTIDALVSELQLSRVDFIKMDIEGAEPNALIGGRRTIETFKPRMAIATEHSPDEYRRVLASILRSGVRYRSTCGRCIAGNGRLYPEVLFFAPR